MGISSRIVRGLLPLLMVVACSRPEGVPVRSEDSPPRPNLLLITVDTLRADHLSGYGYRLPTSPNLDRLASEGVRFADVTVPWPKTWPATASMLTGKYPSATGVRLHPRRRLPGAHETMAELLEGRGYATAAVVANVNVGAKFGFDQGFGTFVEAWAAGLEAASGQTTIDHDPGRVKEFAKADVVTDQAVELLDEFQGRKPFFLWLHYLDPHGPYRPPAEHRDLFAGAYSPRPVDPEDLPVYQRETDASGTLISDLSHYIANYDREIRYFDDQLGRLLDVLSARGLRQNTLIVLTSDHGESLDEDGYYLEHGAAPYQPTASVPLVVVLDGEVPAGRVVSAPVGLVDLLPTVLEVLSVPAPSSVQGASLVTAWSDAAREPGRYVFMESGSYEPSQLSVRKGRFKLARLRSPRDRLRFGRQEFELYDLDLDPEEENDVSSEHPEVALELRLALDAWLQETPPLVAGAEASIDRQTHALLRALGYVEDPPAP